MAAIYRFSGDFVRYTAGTAGVNAGDVVILEGTTVGFAGIAKQDIAPSTEGDLATKGAFEIPCGTATTFSVGAKVYYNSSSKLATATATDFLLGRSFGKVAAGDAKVTVNLNA